MYIPYEYFSKVADYNNNVASSGMIGGINKYSIIRSAIMVGLATKGYRKLSKEVKEWKVKTIDTFVDLNSNPLIFKNIEQIETSEKGAVSFFVGMVFAHLFMQKKYNIRHLEHLKNDGINVIPFKDRKERPDLWGFNKVTGKSYLVEAKGSTTPRRKMAKKTVVVAEKQLGAVKQIKYHTSGSPTMTFDESMNNLNRLIVATFSNENNEVTQHIIDPSDSNEIHVEINGDESIFKYYYNLISWLQTADQRSITLTINGEDISFIVIELSNLDVSIGVSERIYKYFNQIITKEKEYKKEDFKGSNKVINNILDEITEINNTEESISLGIDGVVVLKR